MAGHLVPMKFENWSFFDRQRSVFGDMFKDMDKEFAEFDVELKRMREEMFGSSSLSSLTSGSQKSSITSGSQQNSSLLSSGSQLPSLGSGTQSSSMTSESKTSSVSTSGTKSTTISSKSESSSVTTSGTKGSLLGSESSLLSGAQNSLMTTGARDSSIDMFGTDRPIVCDADGNKRLSIRFNLAGFKPEDITVKTVDNKLIVEAQHKVEAPGKSSYQRCMRQYDLPGKIDPLTLNSVLSSDGVLSIEAPAPQAVEAPKARFISILNLQK